MVPYKETALCEAAPMPADNAEDAAALKKKGPGSYRQSCRTSSAKNQAIVADLQSYLQTETMDAEEDPLMWWRESQKGYPRLSNLSSKYLCIPATCFSSERVFSTGGNIVSCLRSCLKPDHVKRLVLQITVSGIPISAVNSTEETMQLHK